MSQKLLILLNEAAGRLARDNRFHDAAVLFEHTASLFDSSPEVHKNLGDCLYQINKYEDAVKAYKQAMAFRPSYAGALIGIGNAHSAMKQYDIALKSYELAINTEPSNLIAKRNLAICFRNSGQYERSNQILSSLLDFNPGDAGVQLALGTSLMHAGELSQAKEMFTEALANSETRVLAFIYLTRFKEYEADDAILREMIIQSDPGYCIKAETRSLICFALWRAYDKKGLHDLAFEFLSRGNAIKKATNNYVVSKDTRIISIISRTVKDYCRLSVADMDTETKPIFIVGMPRSGSTLLEQILSGHSQITGFGETEIMRKILPRRKIRRFEDLLLLDSSSFNEIRREYISYLTSNDPTTLRFFTDKTLSNFYNLGLLWRIFPNAKFIEMRREPIDNCFACYSTDFEHGHEYTNDLGDLGNYYRAYRRLMKFWIEYLPSGSMTSVKYENVVNDIEGETRRLLKFVGADWEGECVQFTKNRRPISTASMVQVRQPLNSASIGKWRPYEKHLELLKLNLTEDRA